VAGGALADVVDPGLVADELGSTTGRAWLARLVVLAVAAAAVARSRPTTDREGGANPAGRVAVALGGFALLVTVSVTGHAVAGDLVVLAFVTDVVHLAGVSVWLGGLAVLAAAVLRPPARSTAAGDGVRAVEPVVLRFSRVALVAVVVIVASGAVQGWRQVGGYDALLETAYGRLLVAKVAFVVAMLVAAAMSRSWVRERIAHRLTTRTHGAPTQGSAGQLAVLRRSVAAEAGLAVAVLAVTALLVNAVPGATASAGAGAGGPFSTQLTEDGLVLTIEVAPAAVGPVDVHLYVNEPSGTPVRPEEVHATLTLPERDLGPLTVPLVDFGQGHYSGDGADLPFAGEWDLEVVVRTSDIDQTRFGTVVPVS
jgi:copper transport protein